MNRPPPDRCGYTWPENHEIDADPHLQSCCWRETVSDEHDRCVWHVNPDEVVKSPQALRTACAPPETREQTSPYAELLDGANLSGVEIRDKISLENVALRGSDLSDADLEGTNLSNAHLLGANLSGANLRHVDLSGAYLEGINLSGEGLWDADLSGAYLAGAVLSNAALLRVDLSGAFLRDAILSGANIYGADLSDAYFWETNIEGVSVNGATTCKRLNEGFGETVVGSKSPPIHRRQLHRRLLHEMFLFIRQVLQFIRVLTGSQFDSEEWDATARAYHDLKTVFNDHGLIGKARDMHVRERRARSLEAKAAGGWFNWRYLGSLPSRGITGYGVRILRLMFWMGALFLVSTAVYVDVGVEDTLVKNISYSVLAFTVAPPKIPSGVGTQLIMMVETFLGTLFIVLLGYILGNRERF